ncbi:hypothetical protein KC992_02665 [Candidatus Saccharibacteria bacterium]|nr:hypothetical protein [Candidatus Saccharibacteria bacterium]
MTTSLERIVVLKNPVAKNGHVGNRQLTDLRNFLGLPSVTVTTSIDRDETIDSLGILEPTDLLYVIGGDGTVNQTIPSLVSSGAVLLPTRSGNANDLARSLNGKMEPWQVFQRLGEHGVRPEEVRPIQVDITDIVTGLQSSGFAINYASFGYAALASDYINTPWAEGLVKRLYDAAPRQVQKGMRLPREGSMLLRAANDITPFVISITNRQPKFEAKAVDISVTHSPRMAKLGRFPISHMSDEMLFSHLSEAGKGAMLRQFILMMFGKMKVEPIADISFDLSAGAHEHGMMYQVDGEAAKLPNNCHINIRLSDASVKALVTR